MVGIPGRSQACHTCRRRRVKCDLGQPNCARCTKIGKVCEGYERGPVFLNRTVTGLQKRQPMEEALPRQELESRPDILKTNYKPSVEGHHLLELISQPSRILAQIDDTSLTLKKCEILFLEDYLPSDPRLAGNAIGLWVLEAVSVSSPGRALKFAKEALFMTRAGRTNDDSSLFAQGRLRYGHALQELRRALSDGTASMQDETLAACQALTLYEVLESSGSAVKGQMSHLYGIVKLLKHRKSAQSESPLVKALMDYFRYSTMVLCIQERSLALFGGLQEKVSIWLEAKTLEQKLYDHGFILASIFEEIDRILPTTATCEKTSRLKNLLSQCQVLDHELTRWYEELLGAAESIYSWRIFLPQLYSDSEEPIVFPDLRLAHLLLCFWTFRMVLPLTKASIYKMYMQAREKDSPGILGEDSCRSIRKIGVAESINATQGDPQNSLAKDIFATPTRYADLILRAMPYCTSDQMGIASCTRCLFGLRGVLGYLSFTHQHAEKVKICQEFIKKITEERKVCFAADIVSQSGNWKDTKEGLR